MNIEIDEIESVENLGEVSKDFYDVGMEDTPHTFFANDILVHNSCFVSAVPIVKHRNPNMDLTATENNQTMVTEILSVASEVQSYINKAYDVMAKRMFNVTNHTFEIKQEIIATTGIWLAKKRYGLWRINENGKYIKEDSKKLEVKGIDIVRTSFPAKFRTFLEEVLKMILAKTPKDVIDKRILEFRSNLKNCNVTELAKNTSVNFSSGDKSKNYNPKSRTPFSIINGSPAQVKSALYYNDLLKKYNLSSGVEPIFSGSKVKWVYLRENPYNIDCLAFKSDGTDPDKIMDFINTYVDKKGLYEHELKSKLADLYKILGWDLPSSTEQRSKQFFE